MSKIYIVLLCAWCNTSICQTVAINATGSSGDASSMLDISSTNKGLLIPRMSTSQISSIASPAKGLLVYDSTVNQFKVNIGDAVSPNWQLLAGAGSGWNLTGNGGTNSANNFLGTIDDVPLRFRIKNFNAGVIDSAQSNTAIGFRTLDSITSGHGNSAFGFKAMTSNTTGQGNTAIGLGALFANKTGFYNTAVGLSSLGSNTTGYENIAVGYLSLYYNSTGNYNVCMGNQSLFLNTIGYGNSSLGYHSLFSNSNGHDNTGVGYIALGNNNTGYHNVGIGSQALFANKAGFYNVGVGSQAGFTEDALINCTFLGAAADATVNNLSNSTAIGANAKVSASNTIQLGDPFVTNVNTAGNITVLDGKGLIRSSDGTQQKKLMVVVTVSGSFNGFQTRQFNFTFSEAFSAAPDVYVGNITGGGGFAEKPMSIANVTTTGGTLFVYNPASTTDSPNYSIKIIAIGPQ